MRDDVTPVVRSYVHPEEFHKVDVLHASIMDALEICLKMFLPDRTSAKEFNSDPQGQLKIRVESAATLSLKPISESKPELS